MKLHIDSIVHKTVTNLNEQQNVTEFPIRWTDFINLSYLRAKMIDNIELNKRGGLNSCELRTPMGYQRLYTWLTIEI